MTTALTEAPAGHEGWRYAPATAPAGLLDSRSWRAHSHHFDALGHHFAVRSNDRAAVQFINEVFRDLRTGETDEPGWYSLIDRGPSARPQRRWALYFGDEREMFAGSTAKVLATLMWHVNRGAIDRSVRTDVVLHAAAAQHGGVTVVLPAEMESGKTTTVAGLVRAGFGYLTDEAVAISPDSLRITPFPKPLSVDRGSWDVLADLRPDHAETIDDQWQVPASHIRPRAVAGSGLPDLIVAPRYVGAGESRLEPMHRAEALMHLAASTFQFCDDADRNLATLTRVVQGAHGCYRLHVNDLDDAVALVQGLVAQSVSAS